MGHDLTFSRMISVVSLGLLTAVVLVMVLAPSPSIFAG